MLIVRCIAHCMGICACTYWLHPLPRAGATLYDQVLCGEIPSRLDHYSRIQEGNEKEYDGDHGGRGKC